MSGVRLTRRLVLEQEEHLLDGAGGFSTRWVEKGVLWADVRAGTGGEKGADFLTLARVPYRITVRAAAFGAPSRPIPGQQFREGPRAFRILAVADAEGGMFLTCFCQEEVPK